MRPHRTYSITQPDTHLYINDYFNNYSSSDRPAPLPRHREVRCPAALLALALGLGLAILVMLGTWWSLAPQASARGTTFSVHPEEQTLSADEPEHSDLSPACLDDILTRF